MDEKPQHLRTPLFPEPVATERVKDFLRDVRGLIGIYELHGVIVTASIGVETDGDKPDGFIAHSAGFGCTPHNLMFLAQFLADSLSVGDLFYYIQRINALGAERQFKETMKVVEASVNDPDAEKQTSLPTSDKMAEASRFLDDVEKEHAQKAEDKLLNEPLPTGANKWRN